MSMTLFLLMLVASLFGLVVLAYAPAAGRLPKSVRMLIAGILLMVCMTAAIGYLIVAIAEMIGMAKVLFSG